MLEAIRKAALFEASDWFYDFWILYDIDWSLSAALIQLYLNWVQEPERRTYFESHLRDLTRTQSTLRQLVLKGLEASSSSRPEHVTRTSLVASHFPLCLQDRCTCFQEAFGLEVLLSFLSMF